MAAMMVISRRKSAAVWCVQTQHMHGTYASESASSDS